MDNGQAAAVFVVEDSKVVSFAIKASLDRMSDFHLAGLAYDGSSALEGIGRAKPDVVLVDIGLPELSGIEVTRRVKAQRPTIKVIMLTASDTIDDIVGALDAGADGYLLKDAFSDRLEMAMRSVRSGAVWLDPNIAKQLLKQALSNGHNANAVAPSDLTPAEVERLSEVADSSCSDGYCMVDPQFVRKLHDTLTT